MSRDARLLLAMATLAMACDRGVVGTAERTAEGMANVGVPSRRDVVDVRASSIEQPPSRVDEVGSPNQSTSTHTGAPDDDALVGETSERDPRSDTIKVKVLGGERRHAHVFWGRKDFGVAPLEIERPRNSGPLDLVVVAPGYLPYHARAFTDRDDVVSIHLYSPTEAPQLLGYRASDIPAPAPLKRAPR